MNKRKIAILISSALLSIGGSYAQSNDFNSAGVKLRGDGSVDDTQRVKTEADVKLRGDGSVDDTPRVRTIGANPGMDDL